MSNRRLMSLACVLLVSGCGHAPEAAQKNTQTSTGEESVCRIIEASRSLPADVRETSGLARGIQNRAVLWTHNDSGGQPELFALGVDGTITQRVRITGAELIDWEDIESGPCGTDGCLYIADIGDNFGQRSNVTVYEIKEPSSSAASQPAVRVMHVRYPDGPQDAEALFRLPAGELYIVTKGRQKPIRLYRLEPGEGSSSTTMLRLVREIAAQPRSEFDRVTAATASPDGKWIAIRSYTTLYLYQTADLLSGGPPARTFLLGELAERQGEALTLDNDGAVWLTSEAERLGDLPTIARLSCTLN